MIRLFARIFAISAAASTPFCDAFLDPTIATLGLGRGIFIGPATYSSAGAHFLSVSFMGPRSSSGLTTRKNFFELSIELFRLSSVLLSVGARWVVAFSVWSSGLGASIALGGIGDSRVICVW